jgi:hypothetical protein
MFRGNRHNIFRSFLGKDIKRLIDLNSISNLADVFWKRFIGGFGGIVGKENLNFGLFYRKSLVN